MFGKDQINTKSKKEKMKVVTRKAVVENISTRRVGEMKCAVGDQRRWDRNQVTEKGHGTVSYEGKSRRYKNDRTVNKVSSSHHAGIAQVEGRRRLLNEEYFQTLKVLKKEYNRGKTCRFNIK